VWFDLENEQRKTLSSIVLGVLGLFALFLTWRRVRAGDRQVEVAEQGHLTDRFTKAIEQLGKVEDNEPNYEVRLGGIYALERIAYDSPRDHWTIMEVLTAHVRLNAALQQLPTGDGTPAQDDSQEPRVETNSSPQNVKPRTDIQAILTVLGRWERSYRRERGRKLVLSQTDLRGSDFKEAQLQEADFSEAQLQGADFSGVVGLTHEQLADAHLENTVLAEYLLDKDLIQVSQEQEKAAGTE
jgi:Pentapeptide repeats (8 copies)